MRRLRPSPGPRRSRKDAQKQKRGCPSHAVAVASANRLTVAQRLRAQREYTAKQRLRHGASTDSTPGATAGASVTNGASTASTASSASASTALATTVSQPPTSCGEKTCINWGEPPHSDVLQAAIQDWDNKTGSYFDKNGEGIVDYKIFATLHGIPFKNFYKYIHPDPDKHQKLSDGSRGKVRALTNDDVKFFGAVFARADRGNDGLSVKEAVDAIIEYVPTMSRRGANQQLRRHILPKNAGVLKKTIQKVQAITSDRTNINIAQ